MRRPLRMVSWNTNGLLPRRTELIQFLGEYDVDIALLQETHLRPVDRFSLPNYTLYRTDRPNQNRRAAGGTAVAVHRRVCHRHINHQGWRTEVTTVAVDIAGIEVELSSLYNPPGARLCQAELDQLLRPTASSLAAGDFNAKDVNWGCRRTTVNGRALARYLDARPHIFLTAPDSPTHYPVPANNTADILDIALHCNLPVALTVSAVTDLSSDHLPVFCLLEDPNVHQLPTTRRPRVNWRKYRNHLADHPLDPPPPATSSASLDGQVTDLQAKLNEALSAALIPAADIQDHRRRLPDDLMAEVHKRRRLRRVWQTTRCPRDRAAFHRQADMVRTLLQDNSEGKWLDFLSTLATEDGSLWRLAKCLRREKQTHHPLRSGQGLVYSAKDKAETFANEMEKQFSPHDVQDVGHTEAVQAFLTAIQPGEDEEEDDELQPITEEEVTTIIAKLKPKKAPGPDNLGAPALKNLPPWVIHWIVQIFGTCLQLRHFPSPWKTAKVILLQKPGKDRSRPDSYRPISLLPTLAKILERLILARIPDEFHQSIRSEQFGFRRGHSTELQLTRVVTSLVDAANRRQLTSAVFIDVSKAFDKVWHEGLLYKLAHSPLPRSLWWLVKSYLQDRNFKVTVGPATSQLRPVAAGVPQGSVLGPLLYLWYTNDIPVAPRVSLSLYADDAMFSAPSLSIRQSSTYLQRQMDTLSPWLNKWRVKANPAKCEAICFTRKSFGTVQRYTITLQGEAIPWKKTTKYLGVTLDSGLTGGHHVKHRLAMVRAANWKMSPLLQRNSPLSLKTKLLLYVQITRPSLLYAAPAWYQLLAPTWKKRLQSFQSRCLRQATNSPWFVRNSVIAGATAVQSVEDFVKARARAMHARADDSEWQHLRHLTPNPGPPEELFKRPRALLDDPP